MSVKNTKLNSLLNYRFVKKACTKLENNSQEQNTSQESSPIINQSQETVSNSQSEHVKLNSQSAEVLDSQTSSGTSDSTLPYYSGVNASQESGTTILYNDSQNLGSQDPLSDSQNGFHDQITSSPESPIFRGKGRGAVKNCITDDGESSASSPWLSKEQGISTGAFYSSMATNKQRRKSKPEVREGFSDDFNPEQAEKVNSLKSMFPTYKTETLQGALEEAEWDLDDAIDHLIDGTKAAPKTPKRVKKRAYIEDSDSDSSPIHVAAKRARQLNSSDLEASQDQLGEEEKKKKIAFLADAFPHKKEWELYKAMENNNWHADDAMVELSQVMENGNIKRGPDIYDDDDDADFDSEDEGLDSDDSIEMDTEEAMSERDRILAFFNDATASELAASPGCSKKRAEIIISLRPFSDWTALNSALNKDKGLSADIISGCKEIVRVRRVIFRLMQKCESISKKMESVVSYLTKKTEVDNDADENFIHITKQPAFLSERFQLKPFQMVGLNWLRIMHSQQLNGILADEMGLGKTIQTIAFIAHLMEEGEVGPHVVIVPSSTIENWMREFELWCPQVNLLVYYGSQEDRRQSRQSILYDENADYNVVLTTYNMATGSSEDRALFKKVPFHYAVFDEGHMLKNMSSLRYQNLMKISAERRLLLTGTPLQNNLLELMSLLCFVMPEIFSGKTDQLKTMFSMISRGVEEKSKSKYERERILHAKRIMKPFVLRRLKSEVQKQLPKKTEEVQYCDLIPEQQAMYERLIQNFQQAIKDKTVTDSTGGASMLMQLRKAANHPLLLRNQYNDDLLMKMAKQIAKEPSHRDRGALPNLIFEDMQVLNDYDIMRLCDQYKKYIGTHKLGSDFIMNSGKFRKLDEILENFKSQGDRVLLFSQFTMMMDIIEDYLKMRNHSYLRLDGTTPVPERQEMIDRYTKDESIFIFMLSTRAGGLGINLTAANVVIIHDIDFNPYNDKQAEDRSHRVGQSREVKVVRLISKDTVEEGMLRCARDKLKLEKDITTDEDMDKDSAQDVASLLKDALTHTKS